MNSSSWRVLVFKSRMAQIENSTLRSNLVASLGAVFSNVFSSSFDGGTKGSSWSPEGTVSQWLVVVLLTHQIIVLYE